MRRRAVVATSLVALLLLVACNELIGLSEFERGECAGGRCPDAGGPIDSGSQTASDTGSDAPPSGPGADPVSWARWRMPNYGDGGDGQAPLPQALVAEADAVRDTITGLIWRNALLPALLKQADVQAECAKLAGGPWRAPKRIELVTLLDYGRASAPYIDSTKFPTIVNDRVWTTSEARPFDARNPSQGYWAVDFTTGKVEPLRGDFTARVLCVRAR